MNNKGHCGQKSYIISNIGIRSDILMHDLFAKGKIVARLLL